MENEECPKTHQNVGKIRLVRSQVHELCIRADDLEMAHDSTLRNDTLFSDPPYSPDLTPRDFSLFQKLRTVTKGRRFLTFRIFAWPQY